MESIGIPDQYRMAIRVSLQAWQAKLSTRFVAKPDWLRWTATEEGVTRHKKMNTQEPFNNTHKVYLAMFHKKTTEESFNLRIFGEVDKVVNVETKGERR